MNTLLELAFIERFVLAHKRARYVGFVSSVRARPRFIAALPHFRYFDEGLFDEVNSFSDPLVQERLAALGAAGKTCYILSENKAIDGTTISVEEAYRHTGGDGGLVLLFGACNLVYYEGEPPYNRYVSKLR